MPAQWKGFLHFGGMSCAVALYTAASTADRIAFATINKSTGNRVKREYVDVETGKPVEREQQVKGNKFDDGRFIKTQSRVEEKGRCRACGKQRDQHHGHVESVPGGGQVAKSIVTA